VALLDGFTQNLFAIATQHPLVMRPAYAEIAAASPPDAIWAGFVAADPPDPAEPGVGLGDALRRYDHVVFVHNERFHVRESALLEPVHESGHVKLCRVVR
jgi:hypothetical protein